MSELETQTEVVGWRVLPNGPDEKAVERKIEEMGQSGWMLVTRKDVEGYTRFDGKTRLVFQRIRQNRW